MLGLFVAAIFIVLNGFFVAAEFALVKANSTQAFARPRGDKRVARAQSVVSQLERYLSVTQFGITLASLGLGWVGEPAIEAQVTKASIWITGSEPGAGVRIVTVTIAFGALTFAHVLFGELVPKLVSIQRSKSTALLVAGPLLVIYTVFRPLLWVLERATKVILRAMGMSADAASEGKLSEEEILGVLVAHTARAPDGREKGELVERVLRFARRTARNAMVPRVDVLSLPLDTTGERAFEIVRSHQYTRVLLTKGKSLDEVAGYLYSKDFFIDPTTEKLADLRSLRRDVLFVSESQSLLDVLREMQRAKAHIAVVVDEYGGTSGIVTMEDLLEEIVGEIRDESDVEYARVMQVTGEDATWDVDARATLDELKSIGLKASMDEGAEQIGTVVLAKIGRLPRMRDRVELQTGITAEVTSLSRRRVTSVRIHVKKEDEAEA